MQPDYTWTSFLKKYEGIYQCASKRWRREQQADRRGRVMDLSLRCNWNFPTGVQFVENKLSYIQSSVKKKITWIQKPSSTIHRLHWFVASHQKRTSPKLILWGFLLRVFPSEGCLGNPLEGLAEVDLFIQEPISSATQAVGASSGGVC